MSQLRKYVNLVEQYERNTNKFYHGSIKRLDVGVILTPRTNYEDIWGKTDFYNALEYYRPSHMLSHKQSIFMVHDEEDIDLAGGDTEWIFVVKPLGKIQKHDINWSSEISGLIDDGFDILSNEIKNAAYNYWHGVPHYNESVWEYLTTKAEIIDVYEF